MTSLDRPDLVQALQRQRRSLSGRGTDPETVASIVQAALATPSPEASTPERVRAVVDATRALGYLAGSAAGHAFTTRYFASAALNRAEPARIGMSPRWRELADRLQAARLTPPMLRAWLEDHGAQRTATWRGGDIYTLDTPDGRAEVLVPPRDDMSDHVRRIWEAVTVIAELRDTDATSVLADIAPPAAPAPLTHPTLRYLWNLYRAVTDLSRLGAQTHDPGPSAREDADADTTSAAVTNLGDPDLVAELTRIWYMRGHGQGHAEAARAVCDRLAEGTAHRAGDDVLLAVLDGRPAHEWYSLVAAEARLAGLSATHDHRGGLQLLTDPSIGHTHAVIPLSSARGFTPLRAAGQPPTAAPTEPDPAAQATALSNARRRR
jgi:hypothetical protein